MEMIKHLDIYIAAQKATGIHFAIFGASLLIAAVLLHFSQLNPVTQGLRNGFFVTSILLIASGLGFIMNQNKLLQSKTETYQSDQQQFKSEEVDRMQQVSKSVPKIIIGLCTVLILLAVALMFFTHKPFWTGVLCSVLIYLVGLLIIESNSFLSVKNYLESLLNS